MSDYIRTFLAIALFGCLPLNQTFAGDNNDKSAAKTQRVKAPWQMHRRRSRRSPGG